jgi:uncharacterized membrane protein HdeD (DUF308 family)
MIGIVGIIAVLVGAIITIASKSADDPVPGYLFGMDFVFFGLVLVAIHVAMKTVIEEVRKLDKG